MGSDGASAAYQGVIAVRATDNGWVGTRSLWNQHAYSVTNVCGDRGDPCGEGSLYGDIPRNQVDNWSVSFLNNFRQNIQGAGIFDAPDATLTLAADCTVPAELHAAVRNLGQAVLPAGVQVAFYSVVDGVETELGRGVTLTPAFPGQVSRVDFSADPSVNPTTAVFRARIINEAGMETFQECNPDNNESALVRAVCIG